MKLIEKKMNLFDIDDKYYLAHCISSDYVLGAGIAVQFKKRFHLKGKLNQIGNHKYPDCIFINPVFNLVTKKKYWNKPTYQSLTKALEILKKMIVNLNEEGNGIKYIAMPKIASGLDRLQWSKVRGIIQVIFKDIDIEILVCSL